MKTCPQCCSAIPELAEVCPACTRRITGRTCPECAEISKAVAKKCSYCGHSFAREEKIAIVKPFSAKASLLPTILWRGRLIPQEIDISADKIVIRTWGFLWLSHTDEDIPWEKIAGYHYHSGWFWDDIEIQTRGQKSNSIQCLPKPGGLKIKAILEQMKE